MIKTDTIVLCISKISLRVFWQKSRIDDFCFCFSDETFRAEHQWHEDFFGEFESLQNECGDKRVTRKLRRSVKFYGKVVVIEQSFWHRTDFSGIGWLILIVAGLENWVTAAVIKFWVSSDTRKRADDVSNCPVSFMFTALGSFLRGRTSKFFTHSNTNFVKLKLFGSYMCILSLRQQYLDSQRYTLDASTLNYPSVFILHRWRRRSNLEKSLKLTLFLKQNKVLRMRTNCQRPQQQHR